MNESQYKGAIIRKLKEKGWQSYQIDLAGGMYGKRPFDNMLVKGGRAVAVEFKKNYYKIAPHQKLAIQAFDGLACYIVVNDRKRTITVLDKQEKQVFQTQISYEDFSNQFDTIYKGSM